MPSVTYQTLRNFNLAGDYRSKYLDIEATRVDVSIEVDEALDALIKAGKESLKISDLGDVAKAEIDKVAGDFVETIKHIEKKLERELYDEKATEKQIKEANEVLKHYARIVEDNVNAAVEKEWKAYAARREHLKNFRLKCVQRIVLGTIGLGVAVSSAVLSFGTLWINLLSAVRSITELVQTAKTWASDIDDVYADLVKEIGKVDELNRQREEAYKKHNGQKLSKTKEGLKELTNALLPFTKSMLKATSEIESSAKQFLGLVSKLEHQADELTGEMNKAVKLMSKLPDMDLTPELKKLVKEMEQNFDKLFDEISDLHRRSQNAARFGERALDAAHKLRKEDSWGPLDPERTLSLGKKGAAAYSVANFICQCCLDGKGLLAL
jgi:methyl-accepting chemotaxis protein